MMPITPMGVAMRAMSRPFGRFQRASSRPTGSGKAATSATPLAVASMRLASSFKRSTVSYGYDFQAAWYLEAIKAKYPDANEVRFQFLAVEKSLQPLATCFTASELFLNEGRAKNKRALDIYKKCTAENSWPDYNANGPVLLTPDYITAQQLQGVEDDE